MIDKKVVIELSHLEKSFGSNSVLKDINLSVHKGEVISVIGSSGSGKSTMLRCINLLETPTGGDIFYEGKNIQDKDVKLTEYRAKVEMVFQQFNLFNNMTALDNCAKPQRIVLKRSKEEARKIADSESKKLVVYLNNFSCPLWTGSKSALIHIKINTKKRF